MFQTTSRCCLSLASSSLRHGIVVTIVAGVTLFASQTFAWTVKSRELVDIEIASNGSVMVLVSAPGAAAPGLYEWKSSAAEPVKLCAIDSPASFSFDRRTVIERVRGEHDSLRLYDSARCTQRGQIETGGRVQDADASAGFVAVAVLYGNEERALELFTRRGKRIATADIGRNVELGFAPDGKTLINFDLGDTTHATWQLPSLRSVKTALWINSDEIAFIPGVPFVKRYADGALSIMHWVSGKPKYVAPVARTVRVRQLSRNGRYGVTHERVADGDLVEWFDFATGFRTKLGVGSIDHAAISANGTKVAWSQRSGVPGDEVTVWRATITAPGIVQPEP